MPFVVITRRGVGTRKKLHPLIDENQDSHLSGAGLITNGVGKSFKRNGVIYLGNAVLNQNRCYKEIF